MEETGEHRLIPLPWSGWVFLVVSVFIIALILWPAILQPLRLVPAGSEAYRTVPLFNLWTLWWNSQHPTDIWGSYWNAPIFWPSEGALAFSEPQPVTRLLSPVLWMTGSRTLMCTVYTAVSLLLNGWMMRAVLLRTGLGSQPAFLGGLVTLLLPIVHWQLGVIQLIAVWPALWCTEAGMRLFRRPSVAVGLQAGVAFLLTVGSCVHHAFFLAIVGLIAIPLLGFAAFRYRVFWKGQWKAFLVAGLVASASLSVLGPMRSVSKRYEFNRRPETVARLSAIPADFLSVRSRLHEALPTRLAPTRRYLSPGWLILVLSVIGAVAGLRSGRDREAIVILLFLLAVTVALSTGSNLQWASFQLWPHLVKFIPGFAAVRTVYRFAYFSQLIAVFLAMLGVRSLIRMIQSMSGHYPWIARGALAFLLLGPLIEIWPPEITTAEVPLVDRHRGWIEFVRENTTVGDTLVCLPFSLGSHVEQFETSTDWMYLQTFHEIPMVNGYSGFLPKNYYELRKAVNLEFPTRRLLAEFADLKVKYVVVMSHLFSEKTMDMARFDTIRLEPVWRGTSRVIVYELIDERNQIQ